MSTSRLTRLLAVMLASIALAAALNACGNASEGAQTSNEQQTSPADSPHSNQEEPDSNDGTSELLISPIRAGHWHGKAIATDGNDANFASDDDADSFYLDVVGGTSGTMTLCMGDENYEGTYVQLEDYDGTRKDGAQAKAFIAQLGSASYIGFTNSTTCLLVLVQDADYKLIFSTDRNAQPSDIDLDFGDMSSAIDAAEEALSDSSGSSADSSPSPDQGSSSSQGSSRIPESSASSSATIGEKNALDSALGYLEHVGGFSRSGLIDQLEYEGFTSSEAEYAVDHCGADWKEQAAISAKSYMATVGGFSRSSLIEQLEYEGFTYEEAECGAEAVGY